MKFIPYFYLFIYIIYSFYLFYLLFILFYLYYYYYYYYFSVDANINGAYTALKQLGNIKLKNSTESVLSFLKSDNNCNQNPNCKHNYEIDLEQSSTTVITHDISTASYITSLWLTLVMLTGDYYEEMLLMSPLLLQVEVNDVHDKVRGDVRGDKCQDRFEVNKQWFSTGFEFFIAVINMYNLLH